MVTWEWSVVELFDDAVTDAVVVDASETDALGDTRTLAHDTRGAHAGAELVLQHLGQAVLVDVSWQVGEVQVGWILFTLLGKLNVLLLFLHLLQRFASVFRVLVVNETVALAFAVLLLNDRLGRLDFTESEPEELS